MSNSCLKFSTLYETMTLTFDLLTTAQSVTRDSSHLVRLAKYESYNTV